MISLPLKVRDSAGSVELWDHAEGVYPPRATRQDSSSFGSFQQFLQLRGDVHLRHRLRRIRHLQGNMGLSVFSFVNLVNWPFLRWIRLISEQKT